MQAESIPHCRWFQVSLAILAVGVYLNAFDNQFLWDDIFLIVDNPTIKHWHTLPALFTGDILPGSEDTDRSNYFRPLQVLTYALDYQVWGLDPRGFHLTSTLLHAVAAVLLFRLGLLLLGEPVSASVAAALWAVHPVHTEAVTYIAGRSDPLAGVLLLASLLAFARDRHARFSLWRAWSLGAFFLALLAREAALVWLLLVPLVDVALDRGTLDRDAGVRRQAPRATWRDRLIWRYVPYLAVAMGYLALRFLAIDLVPMTGGSAGVSLDLRLLTMLKVIALYLGFLLVPANPHMERRVEAASSFAEPAIFGSALLIAVLILLAWRWRRRAWPLTFGVAWFLIALLAVANIVPLATFMAEHWLYVPSMGLFLAVGWAAQRVAGRWRRRLMVALMMAVVGYGSATVHRNRDWRDARTLFESTVESAPWSARAWANLGNAYLELGDFDQARPALERAIEIGGGGARVARLDLGVLDRREGRLESALEAFDSVLASQPATAVAYNEIALTLSALGRLEEAGQAFERALELDPGIAAIHSNYGNWLFRRDDLAPALERYREALRLDPDYAEAYNNLGSVYFRMGRPGPAAAAYERALELDPGLDQVRANLEVVRRAAGEAAP